MLGGAYAIKEDIELSEIEKLKEYIEKISGSDIELETGDKVKILKADIKERKGEAFLIFRYQVIM